MSRIGKTPIELPKGVELKIEGNDITVKGPLGNLRRSVHKSVTVSQEGNQVVVSPRDDSKALRKFHGLSRSLVNNMVEGVSKGFSKSLTLIGVGYRAALKGDSLQLTLGFSHPVLYKIDQNLKVKVDKQTSVTITGIDKELVGQTAANIRAFRKPEPYHGKGVRYSDEVIKTKVGKAGAKK